VNYARLNHILIPTTKDERDRFRRSRWSKWLFGPLAATYFSLSTEGRLLLLFAMVAGFAGLDVERSQSHVLWAILTSVILASIAVRRLFTLDGVRLRVVGPDRVTVGEPARFRVTLENRGPRVHHTLQIVRPFLPWDGKWQMAAPQLAELPAGERRTVEAKARFEARGPHHIDSFSAAALVPLSLALGKGIDSTGTRFTVIPQLARVQRIALPISPRYQPGGVALASITGESMELLGVRPYRDGDRIRDLHAVTWARTGAPAVREYQQEYFSRVGVVLDTDIARAGEEALEAAISLAAGIIARLSRGEALIDLLVTGNQLHPLTLGRSLGHLDQALDHLACVEPGPVFDSQLVAGLLRSHLARLSSVVFVALWWDERRRALAHAIREGGVGCSTLVVADTDAGGDAREGAPADDTDGRAPAVAADGDAGVQRLTVAQVRGACSDGGDLVL
jgi:uncharacterized protein (DUF58 family)